MSKKSAPSNDRNQLYRERLRASGCEEILLKLPKEVVELLDQIKERKGLRGRSQAFLQMIHRGGPPDRTNLTNRRSVQQTHSFVSP
jgi:metal-responsive CopG/Arc/MetJ family transcriptional regulator